MPRAVSAAPASKGGFDPKRFSSLPVWAPAISMASVEGTRNSPAPVTEEPNP